jgi:hypothetical protein
MNIYFITFVKSAYRKELMFVLIEFVRNVINLIMIYMSSNRNSNYRSLIDRSFMQKGNKFY